MYCSTLSKSIRRHSDELWESKKAAGTDRALVHEGSQFYPEILYKRPGNNTKLRIEAIGSKHDFASRQHEIQTVTISFGPSWLSEAIEEGGEFPLSSSA